MPQKFKRFFGRKGIHINAPYNLASWYRPSHQKYAAEYNRKWDEWIENHGNASRADLLWKAHQMRGAYADKYSKPVSRGCQSAGDCRVGDYPARAA